MLFLDKKVLAKALLPRVFMYVLGFVLFIVAQVVIIDAVKAPSTAEAQPSSSDERTRTRALEGIHDELRRIRQLMEQQNRRARGD